MAKTFQVAPELIEQIVDFLIKHHLLIRSKNELQRSNQGWLRLESTSPLVNQTHIHWRNKAIQFLDHPGKDDFHYSGIFALDLTTAQQIRGILLDNMKNCMKLIEPAPEQELFAINIDLFQINK